MITKKIAELEVELAAKRTRMKSIMEAAIKDDDRDLDESEAEEYDGLADEVKDAETRLRRLQALSNSVSTAKAVRGDDPHAARASRGLPHAEVKRKGEPGVDFARMVMCFARARGNRFEAVEIAKNVYPNQRNIAEVLKAQVPGAVTSDPAWAGDLVYAENLISEFVEYLRPMTVVGRFGAGGVPGLRRVPFNVSIPMQTSGGEGYWVGEGKPKPLTQFEFDRTTLTWTKVSNIAVLTEELLRFSSPSAELLVRNSLAEALVARLDTDFVDPTFTGAANVSPASPFYGASTSVASGPTAADFREDLRLAMTHFITYNIPVTGIVIIMRSSQALALSLLRNTMGAKEFPELTMNGGMIEGLPVIASQYVPSGIIEFVSAGNVYLADDGGVSIDMSREASLEMADSGLTMDVNDGASPPVSVESTVVSMFQTNSVAIRAERFINWKKRRTAAAYYLSSCGYGDSQSPYEAI
jgi:HK97 family phage major capsid protein